MSVAAIPVPLGLGLLVSRARPTWRQVVALVLCMAWVPAENPYLCPILPLAVAARAVQALRHQRPNATRLAVALVLGGLATVAVLWVLVRNAAGDYPAAADFRSWSWAGMSIPALQSSKPGLFDLLVPTAGGAYEVGGLARAVERQSLTLGLAPLALAGIALSRHGRRCWPWAAMLGAGVMLTASGSFAPLPSPFQLMNALLAAVFRPLASSRPFVVVAVVALAPCVALGMDLLRGHGRQVAILATALLLIEGFCLGGAALRVPARAVAQVTFGAEVPTGGVLLWPPFPPWRTLPMELQVSHGQPIAKRCEPSWSPEGSLVMDHISSLGWREPLMRAPDIDALYLLGFRSVIVSPQTSPAEMATLTRALGPPVATSNAYSLHVLLPHGAQ